MKLKIDGLQELIDSLNEVESNGILPTTDVLMTEGEELAKKIKSVAPTDESHFEHEKEQIKPSVKIDSNTLKVIDVGLKDNYPKYKGLFSNNYGFKHNRSGKIVTTRKLWFDKAVKQFERETIERVFRKTLERVSNVL